VPSAAAAAEQLGCPVGAIANSLVFTADVGVVLVLASGAHRVDPGRLAVHLGVAKRRVKRADPDAVLRATGQRVGGVAPVGHPAPLPCVVDVALTAYPTVWAGAGDEHAMFPTTAAELVELTGGTPLEVAAD
jgi:prolyl-tRNA editing enzyme YbaK/EbsC (Cys-tRNA(Pro) deacylase)